MNRQYLYVPYEEKNEVEECGAHWDGYTKRWYLTSQHNRSLFERWLTFDASDAPGERYLIESDRAYVACAQAHCRHCAAPIKVITLYCVHGTLQGEPLDDFSVMHITAVSKELAEQLKPWPFFRKHASLFRNYCPQCHAPQEDIDLHCEPDGAFFRMDAASRMAMTWTPLAGRVRMSGAETFEA